MPASLLTDIGAEAAAVGAIIVALSLVAKSRPCRWVWAKLVAQPLSGWLRAEITHVVEPMVAEVRAELKPNGGSSLRDRVDRIERIVSGGDP